MFTKSYSSPGPEAPCCPVLTLVIRGVLIDCFILLMGNQGHVCHPHRSDLDNRRTHQQSSVKAPCGVGSAKGKHFQKRGGPWYPSVLVRKKEAGPRIRQGTQAQEAWSQACPIQTQDPRSQVEAGILVLTEFLTSSLFTGTV